MTDNDNNKKKDIDEYTGVETTNHEWDGIKELNNPAPRLWLWIFVLCCVWSVGYWIVYPTWPTLTGHTKGTYEWSSYKQLREEQKGILARKEAYLNDFKGLSLAEIQKDDRLHSFALAGGKFAFKNNCAMCHGTGAEGNGRYPNLNDDDWLWGGSLDDIYTTIKYGIRSSHDDTRYSEMPAFGRDELLESQDISNVIVHVRSLTGKSEPNEAGAAVFAENCAACHGDAGTGDRTLGAPNLADAIWLYGSDVKDLSITIGQSRNGVMPHWEGRLSDETIKQLSLYVHSLGGGE